MKKPVERIHKVADNLYVEEPENETRIFLYTRPGGQEVIVRVEQLPALVAALDEIAQRRFPPLDAG